MDVTITKENIDREQYHEKILSYSDLAIECHAMESMLGPLELFSSHLEEDMGHANLRASG